MHDRLFDMVNQAKQIVFFGGAGVSCASGIPDFRSQDGLYRQNYLYSPEQILSHSFFMSNPQEFYRFYREKMIVPHAKPNAAHLALASLEKEGRLKAVVTQNIDGLHQQAGSQCVYELHGSIHRSTCMECGTEAGPAHMMQSEGVPQCACGGILKPDVVLYEEALDERVVRGAIRAITQADLLIVGGTSLSVYPAAGLLQYYMGDELVVINREATPIDRQATLLLQGDIAEIMRMPGSSFCTNQQT